MVGIFLLSHKFHEFVAQVLGGEDVEGGERLVHEQDFGLDDQGAGEADALLHAAGELFGIGGLEAVEADGVDHVQRALVALDRADAARYQRRFHVLQHGQPRKQGEALKHDGDVGNCPSIGLPCQSTWPEEG